MNWQHLMYFKRVAEVGILTKAAEELYITPSALSRAIDSLQDELGVVLFDKRGRNIALNRYGRIFYDYVSEAANSLDTGVKTINTMADVMKGSVRVSSIFSVGTNFIPDLLCDFYGRTSNREIKIQLSQRPTLQILENIRDGELDIGFCGEFDNTKQYEEINREAIYDEKMMLIVPKSHRLATKKSVCFKEIRDEVFVGYNNSTGIVNTVYDAVARHGYPGFRFNTFIESNEDNNVTNFVKKGLGIAFVVDNPSIYTGGVQVLDVEDLHFTRTIYMVWKRNSWLSPAAEKFRKEVLVYKAMERV